MNKRDRAQYLKYAERCEQAARVVKGIPDEHFNMLSFGYQTPDCGTIACIAGYCSLDPWFRKRGFVGTWIGPPDIQSLLLSSGERWKDKIPKFFGPLADDSLVVPTNIKYYIHTLTPAQASEELMNLARVYRRRANA